MLLTVDFFLVITVSSDKFNVNIKPRSAADNSKLKDERRKS
jgi:hypothetical protein